LAEEAIRHTEVVGFRIEHRPPEGPSRLLGETTMWATAAQSATAWARRLRLSGRAGTVVAVRAGSGEAVVERPIGPPRPPPGSLTPRQAEVLTLVCAGHADAEAAACLGLAPAGIRKFRWRIRHHLGVGSLAEAC
jgi:DNA-binding CsgD family transcriptional regulator